MGTKPLVTPVFPSEKRGHLREDLLAVVMHLFFAVVPVALKVAELGHRDYHAHDLFLL